MLVIKISKEFQQKMEVLVETSWRRYLPEDSREVAALSGWEFDQLVEDGRQSGGHDIAKAFWPLHGARYGTQDFCVAWWQANDALRWGYDTHDVIDIMVEWLTSGRAVVRWE